MPPLRLAAPLARFRPAVIAPWRRIPFPALALAVGLLFAAVGAAVAGDYGIGGDGFIQRRIAINNINYAAGDRGLLLGEQHAYVDRFYGLAFELPLLLAERVLALSDFPDIYLMRHLLTHLFFIAGGFVCGLLAWRMFNNRWLALLAMLLFLLHPRLYAHSFFSSKDIPFAVMFVIALYLTHRAFRRDTLGAFVLLGVVVGLAVNMRPFALLLIPAVLALRGLDCWFADDGARRKRILTAAAVFAAITVATIYVSQPYYWEDPRRYIEGLETLSQHPTLAESLFRSQVIRSDSLPPDYIPVWFGITAPPAALLLGAAGIAAVLWRGFRAPGRALQNGELRFLLLLLACFILPVAAVIALESTIYDGWRQMHFLWGPFCLLAAAGMHYIWKSGRGKTGLKLPLRIAVWGAAMAGLAATLYAIVSLHPHQQVYFNRPAHLLFQGELGQRYSMDDWGVSIRQGMEYLLERHPEATPYVLDRAWLKGRHLVVPGAERIVKSDGWAADYHLGTQRNMQVRGMALGPAVYARRAYGGEYMAVVAPRLVWGGSVRPGEDVYRAAYKSLTAAESPAARADFDVYIHDGALYYVKDNCVPGDTEARVFLGLYPADRADLPAYRRQFGFDNRNFDFAWRGGFFDGKCITQEPLPDYPIKRIRTGQSIAGSGAIWLVEIDIAAHTRLREMEAGLGNPALAAKGFFDVYIDGDNVVYRRETCAAADTDARFFLHATPLLNDDLPEERRPAGFDNLDFSFDQRGVISGGKCLSIAPLPDYPVKRIRTGQHITGRGEIWQADVDIPAPAQMRELEAKLVNPALVAGGFFDVYLDGGNVVYRRETCDAANVAGRFFLHITPLLADDLPADRRQIGFNNLGFDFDSRGVSFGGKCLAIAPLPDYPIKRIGTGQFVAGRGEIWRAEVDVPAAMQMRMLESGVENSALASGGFFDVYIDGDKLVYRREPCAAADVGAKFYLHIVPQDVADLPSDSREAGFDNRDFWFADRGVIAGGLCLATAGLPDYPVKRIRTGQHIAGRGELWRADFLAGGN